MRTSVRRLILVAFGLVFVMPSPAHAQGPCPNADVPILSLSQAAAHEALRCLHDRARAVAGVPMASLRINDRLTRQAQAYSEDMIRRKFFGHVTPDGVRLRERSFQFGYARDGCSWQIGENLAWHSGVTTRTARGFVQSWMNSPSHRDNIVARYQEIGFGVERGTPVASPSDGVTVTAEFGTLTCDGDMDSDDLGAGAVADVSLTPQRNANGSRKPVRLRVRDAQGRRGGVVAFSATAQAVSARGRGRFKICTASTCQNRRSIRVRAGRTVTVYQYTAFSTYTLQIRIRD